MSGFGQEFPTNFWPDSDFAPETPIPVDIVAIIGTEAASKVAFFIRQNARLQYRDNTPQQWALMNLAAQIEQRITGVERTEQ